MASQSGNLLEAIATLVVLAVALVEMAKQSIASRAEPSRHSSGDAAEGQDPNEISPRADSSTTPDAP